MNYKLRDKVTTEYYDDEIFEVVGIRENELELKGDWSGGTHNVCQKSWYPIEKCRTANEAKSIAIENIAKAYAAYAAKHEDVTTELGIHLVKSCFIDGYNTKISGK